VLKVIFFDAAGTLFEPREQVGRTYARLARGYGVAASDEQVHNAFRRTFASAPGLAFGPGHGAAELRRLERQWWHGLVKATFVELGTFTRFDEYFDKLFAYFADPDNWCLDPQAQPTLARLRAAGFSLGMISNFDFRLYGIIEGLGLTNFFTSITISSEAGYAKPAPEIFQVALAKHGAAAAEALHVGDVEQLDLAGALGAGIGGVLIEPMAAEPLRIEGRSARAASLTAVADAVEGGRFP
jgi:putative hydrolase of the HAD superfamily